MKYKLVLFDADGTLFDFDNAELKAFKKTMREFGIDNNLDYFHRAYEKINKAIWLDFQNKKISSVRLRVERFKRFFEAQDMDISPEKFSPVYLKNLSEGTDLLPHAEEIVEYFNGKCTMALATNGLSDVQRPRFAASRLAKYFKYIYISEEIGYPKPEIEYFQHIFEKITPTSPAIIIGDNLSSDIAGGNNAGIDSCWYNPDKLDNNTGIIPTCEITDLLELKNLL